MVRFNGLLAGKYFGEPGLGCWLALPPITLHGDNPGMMRLGTLSRRVALKRPTAKLSRTSMELALLLSLSSASVAQRAPGLIR